VPIANIYIDEAVSDFPETVSILKRINKPHQIIHNIKQLFDQVSSEEDPVTSGKNILFLTQNKGAFLKKCPGTSFYTCCDYQILHIGNFCSMDCSYCILQAYFHPPVLQYFVNYRDLFEEIGSQFSLKKINRIGTGEFTDSMIWEHMSDLTQQLINRFSFQDTSVLELKTKTSAIKSLKHLSHNQKTIASWSLNSEAVIDNEERQTSSLAARLRAAAQCESMGYPLAFHFDPLVIYDGCEKAYIEVIEKMFNCISPERIVWISLGSFRFIPSLKPIIQKRFPESTIIYGEFISGLDGKMRYFKPLRINLYKKIISFIRKISSDVLVYLCMEDDEVWKKSLGFVPSEKGGLPRMLDESAIRHCNLDRSYL
jgi:spore photoproduct lyase